MAKKKYPDIPSHIRVKPKRDYEVTYISNFKDEHQVGECRWEPPQIVIKASQSDTEKFSTFIHELIHLFAYEADVTLTESQVLKLEKVVLRAFRLNKWGVDK